MAATPESRNTFVSVIVPVWNDTERLQRCLEALGVQTYPNDSFEVIVVDNNSVERIEDGLKLAQVVSVHGHARVVHEKTPGSYAARNAGLKHAQGEIVAFTDSDCIPAPDWIERGVAHLVAPENNCEIVAGRIEIFPREAAQPNAVEQYEKLVALAQEEFVTKYRFGATANLFARREVFVQVGLFLAEVKSGGDLEWGRRASSAGYNLEYAESVRVLHPARSSFAQLYSKIVRVTGGLHDLKRLKGQSYVEFDRGWWWDILPPVKAMANVMRESSIPRWTDRIKVCSVLCFVRLVQAFEKFRLAFPGFSNHTTTR